MFKDTTIGLWIFIIVVLVNLVGLVIDRILAYHNLTTITNLVVYYPIVGAAIISLEIAGVLGLVYHFWGSR